MDISYKKDLRHNYLVIPRPDDANDETYCVYMLEANTIDSILRPEPRTIDNQVFYYYDITAKQSLDTIYIKNSINYEKLKGLFIDIANFIEQAYEYLLNENDLLLKPEHIYVELSTGRTNLVYLPGYNRGFDKQISSLIEYLMNKVKYNDKEAVLYIYNLYAACREEGCCFNNLLSVIRDEILDRSNKVESKKRRNSINIETNTETNVENDTETDIETNIEANTYSNAKDTNTYSRPKEANTYSKAKDTNTYIKSKDAITFGVSRGTLEEDKEKHDILVMMEKISDEREIYYYPIKTYICAGASIVGAILVLIIAINMRIVYTSLCNRIDYSKLIALLIILIIIVGYLLRIIINKDNRLTKIISKPEYIDPRIDNMAKIKAEDKLGQIKTVDEFDLLKNKPNDTYRQENNSEATVLLNEKTLNLGCYLEAVNKDTCDTIQLTDFPFIIGKQKGNVDYPLDKEIVSRYHLKLTKEEDNYYITDLNSTNGTTLNDKPLPCYQRHKIIKDDRVSIAGINYIFKIS